MNGTYERLSGIRREKLSERRDIGLHRLLQQGFEIENAFHRGIYTVESADYFSSLEKCESRLRIP
jgi:hypothetical protein